MQAWTDYPISQLGDEPHAEAPVRECTILSYDRDKYCRVLIQGVTTSIKRGYLYGKKGRSGEVSHLSHYQLRRLPVS